MRSINITPVGFDLDSSASVTATTTNPAFTSTTYYALAVARDILVPVSLAILLLLDLFVLDTLDFVCSALGVLKGVSKLLLRFIVGLK